LEELQFSFNEGACIEAANTGAPVLVSDLDDRVDTARWPLFAAAVRERTDVRAFFALPLQWGAVRLGVLDLYRVTGGGLSEHQLWDAISAADAAALMLLGQRTDPTGDGGWWTWPWVIGRRSIKPPGWCWSSSMSTRLMRWRACGAMPSPTV
jgi:GAF domain-containing protein